MEEKKLIEVTVNWLENVIINLNLCPFAKEPYENNDIEFLTTTMKSIEKDLIHSKTNLEKNLFQTSILIFKDQPTFFELLDLIEFLNTTYNSQSQYQFIAFHPQFRFEGLEEEDVANYVNRSPLPIIHILRNADLDLFKNVEKAKALSLLNEKKLKSLSIESLENYFYYLKNPYK